MPVAISYPADVLPAAIINSKLTTASLPPLANNEALVDRIVQIIANYLLTSGPEDQFISTGRAYLRSQVKRHVEQNKPLEFVLPAFPAKSPSLKKVLGTLPDLAEEIFLRRLEDLCLSVEDVYSPGAQLKIVSDGIVYGEILGVTDSIAYKYNAELRKMVNDLKLSHIKFVRVQELVSDKHTTGDIVDVSEDDYVVQAPKTRQAFLATDIGNWDVEEKLKTDEGILRTYRGYLRFLKLDLEPRQNFTVEDKEVASFVELSGKAQRRVIGSVAKQMLGNGARFSALVERSFAAAIRLSIHPHPNAGPKFALRMFADIEQACTPWHNVAIMKRDGSFGIQHNSEVDRATHELVYRRGRPYYWRETDPAMQWGDHMGVMFDRLFPYGLLIRPVPGAVISWNDVPMEKIRDLASRYPLVLARGFGRVDKDEYRAKAREMGTILSWIFGDIFEVKEDPASDMISSTREAMPYHFDCVFKTKVNEDGTVSADPPQFQVFQCRQAPSADDPAADAGGRTLFANTALVYNQAIANNASPYAEDIKNHKWTLFMGKIKSFDIGGQPVELPLVETNPLNGRKIVRWHEQWPEHITQQKPITCNIIGADEELSTEIGNHITELLYDRRFCFQQTWETGDYMIADNFELLHGRTAFAPCPRELWRIHVD